jgi:hypothetical protein
VVGDLVTHDCFTKLAQAQREVDVVA